ncbi:MAG: hypothetical protein DRP08_00815 [Candidatus Aenigmatarchaeota archaeon]|nr:MAG: hypothetical protein DRP08_00815 [Candidatus Aenigmarchaeota archaeon]
MFMPYTFKPEKAYARAYGRNIPISTKDAILICKKIRKKSFFKSKKLLEDLKMKKISLGGKYYTKAVTNILKLLESAEKNAEFSELNLDKCVVYASASHGAIVHRRRRASNFGSKLKYTNLEIIVVDRSAKKEVEPQQKKETAAKQETGKQADAKKKDTAKERKKSEENIKKESSGEVKKSV